jgi:hypothetical protein
VPSIRAHRGLGGETRQHRPRCRQAIGSSDDLAVTSHTLVLSEASGERSAHARHAGDRCADGWLLACMTGASAFTRALAQLPMAISWVMEAALPVVVSILLYWPTRVPV